MPDVGAGFGYAVFGTDTFGQEPDTTGFTTKIEAEYNEPYLRLVIKGITYEDFVIDAPTISRGADIIAGTINVVLSNTPRAQIHGVGIAFVDASPATITDTGSGFINAGFEPGDRITISGSTSNDGIYIIAGLISGTLTLVAGDSLTNEGASALVSILAQPAFNFFVENRIDNMGIPARLGLRFAETAGVLYLLTGTVEEVSYSGARVTLAIRDRMAPMLERRIGSGQDPVDYHSRITQVSPALLAWELLTVFGELDNTFNTDNVDIDHASWSAWSTLVDNHNYKVKARFPGTTIQNALLRIADMTNSFIWVSGEGKFKFAMFEPPHTADGSDETFDTDNCVNIDPAIDKSTIINVARIMFGHQPDKNYEPEAKITSKLIGFGDDNPDRIYLVEHDIDFGFLAAGFREGEAVTIRGSKENDGVYGVETVANGVMHIFEAVGLTDELDGEQTGTTVTLTQSQDTSTYISTALVFNSNAGNDTIYDVTGSFTLQGIIGTDSVTISGSASNDGTFTVDSIDANTITLDAAETLVQEPSGTVITLTQTHTISYTSNTIGFDDDEVGGGFGWDFEPADVDHIFDTAKQFADEGFNHQYDVTVSGSLSNDGTYRLQSMTDEKLNLEHQSMEDEASGNTITITQRHDLDTTGQQYESNITLIDDLSINLYGLRPYVDEDRVIWHANLKSAAEMGKQRILIYKFPKEIIKLQATMTGFLSEPGDLIHVTEGQKEINDRTYYTKSLDLDIEQGIANIKAIRGNTGE